MEVSLLMVSIITSKVLQSDILPSKIFEYAATYKPIIAGVDGYAKDFLKTHLPDAIIYKPCNMDDFCKKFGSFDGTVDIGNRVDFINKFSRNNIMDAMAKDFLNVLKGKYCFIPWRENA